MNDLPHSLVERLRNVKIFLCDVDGILTDATVYMGGGDAETKRFHIQDGLGLRLLQREGIKVGWISNRPSMATAQRAKDLKIDFLHQMDGNKVTAIEKILGDVNLKWDDACYMGDDIVDLGALKRAGLAVTVPHSISECQDLAHYVTEQPGGDGAVREVVEMILKAQGKWEALVRHFSQ
jgi:3-deoxy-D-manno-octulosonate 8-phosphate phosphatase (KDO 8-P phosphatase)